MTSSTKLQHFRSDMSSRSTQLDLNQLQARLEYYQELGIRELRIPPNLSFSKIATEISEPLSQLRRANGQPELYTPSTSESLEDIQKDLGDCRRCKLCLKRTHIVFGSGAPQAKLVFVGEGPGADEDAQGLPFVGRAGQLLTKIIEAIELSRSEVYICNVVKCRPPGNRFPEEEEIAACSPFLFRQLESIAPKIICCLGTAAAQTVLQTKLSIGKLRGRFHDYRGMQVMPTYHPSYLLRNPEAKRDVWDDIKKVRARLNDLV